MNKWNGTGRLTRDPEVRYTQGNKPMCIARYTLAVDRRFKREGEPTADFINCIAFGKNGEFVEKYVKKGVKLAVSGHIQTGSYTNRENKKVYTTDIVVDEQEFCESKSASNQNQQNQNYDQQSFPQEMPNQGYAPQNSYPQNPAPAAPQYQQSTMEGLDGFMNIPDGIDEQLPFA